MGGGQRAKKLRKLIYGSVSHLPKEDRQYTRREDGAIQSVGRRFIYRRAKELKK